MKGKESVKNGNSKTRRIRESKGIGDKGWNGKKKE